ncbi:acyl-CoA dehydrogenase family protein [Humibacter sp.]|uniref:acyl-CoA dehydrogenase family protein n=1 Tax=Humibacter sp. TaxID=1940291 RepID=UPI002BCBE4DF|nr:acyl-CoA dehydrogenase family protein [Humibacter sp.]HVX09169.1 acyl-CoA dehydrogenase family protein [Humibacter sp.]
MDLRHSDADIAFRDELRAWLAATLPTLPPEPDRDDWTAHRAYCGAWQRRLFDAGYAGLDWPIEWGGRGATPTRQLIFLSELAHADAPYVGTNFVGLLHAGPTLMVEGTDEQRAQHVPAILRGEQVWCQGFSEPDAGSDLASLRTGAVRDGDSYRVTGRKVWTSHAMVADYCELLVRTDPSARKHRGISWLILPMDAPGVSVRPIKTAAGTSEFCELVLDDVPIPVANRVGAEGDGWRIAMTTLGFERGTAWIGDMMTTRTLLRNLVGVARQTSDGATKSSAWSDTHVQSELARLAAEIDGLWALTYRNVSEATSGLVPERGASVLKLRFTECRQRLDDVAADILGRASLTLDDLPGVASGRFSVDRLTTLAFTIAAGTSQIQRNILAERALGLPKEPEVRIPCG